VFNRLKDDHKRAGKDMEGGVRGFLMGSRKHVTLQAFTHNGGASNQKLPE
jgi:hypothetical protein